MFFNIGSTRLDNFPKNYQHNNLHVNLDAGWHEARDQYDNVLFYKGYVDDISIKDVLLEIAEQEEPKFYGNFCLIKCFNQGVTIKTDRLRSFPIWYDTHSGLTNLIPLESQIWTDSYLMIQDNGELIESKFNYYDRVECSTLTLDQVVDQVDQILSNKIQNFVQHNSLPLKVFLSGGIDTGLLYSYILKYNIPHELIDYEHIDFDYFYLKNRSAIRNFCNGDALVYDYYVEQWAIFKDIDGVDAVSFQDRYTYITPSGEIRKENSSFTDDGAFVPMVVETGWLNLAGLQNYQRIYHIMLVGTYKSPHTLQIQLYRDFIDTPYETVTIPVLTAPTKYQYRIFPSIQKCEAIKMKITELQTAPYGEGFDISAINIEVGVKRGQNKLSPDESYG